MTTADRKLNLIRQKICRFNKARNWEQFHSPKNLAMALSVEAAELMEHFQWLTPEESRTLPPEKLRQIEEEIGDIMVYLINLADKLGIDPVRAADKKISKNQKKYPVEKAYGSRKKYTERQGKGRIWRGTVETAGRRPNRPVRAGVLRKKCAADEAILLVMANSADTVCQISSARKTADAVCRIQYQGDANPIPSALVGVCRFNECKRSIGACVL